MESLQWRIHYSLSSSQFATRFDQYKNTYRMLAVQANVHVDEDFPDPDDVTVKYAGIWASDPAHRGWVEVRDIPDKGALDQRREQYEDAGYRPMVIEEYFREDQCTVLGGCVLATTYAMIWRRNT